MTLAESGISPAVIKEYCRRWKIAELALFGSILTDEFGPGSGIDVLVTYSDEAPRSLLDVASTREELEHLVGRRVNLVEKDAVWTLWSG